MSAEVAGQPKLLLLRNWKGWIRCMRKYVWIAGAIVCISSCISENHNTEYKTEIGGPAIILDLSTSKDRVHEWVRQYTDCNWHMTGSYWYFGLCTINWKMWSERDRWMVHSYRCECKWIYKAYSIMNYVNTTCLVLITLHHLRQLVVQDYKSYRHVEIWDSLIDYSVSIQAYIMWYMHMHMCNVTVEMFSTTCASLSSLSVVPSGLVWSDFFALLRCDHECDWLVCQILKLKQNLTGLRQTSHKQLLTVLGPHWAS